VDQPCAVNTPVIEDFELQNITSNKLKFSFAPPAEDICQITFTPEKGSIAPVRNLIIIHETRVLCSVRKLYDITSIIMGNNNQITENLTLRL